MTNPKILKDSRVGLDVQLSKIIAMECILGTQKPYIEANSHPT